MSKLVLTQELAEKFAAALLAVIRADHEISAAEGRAVQDTVAALVPDLTLDFADVMLTGVTPESFARAVGASRSSPYRGQPVSSPGEIAEAFRTAAARVASSDGNLGNHEARIVTRYVTALTNLQARGQ